MSDQSGDRIVQMHEAKILEALEYFTEAARELQEMVIGIRYSLREIEERVIAEVQPYNNSLARIEARLDEELRDIHAALSMIANHTGQTLEILKPGSA